MRIELQRRLEQKLNAYLEANDATPNCFMFALDAALGGKLEPDDYNFFENNRVASISAHQETLLKAIYGRGGYGGCSHFDLMIYSSAQRDSVIQALAENITAALSEQPVDRRVLISAPGLRRGTNHVRAIIPETEECLFVDSLDPELVRQIPVSSAKAEISCALATGRVATLGFRIDFPKPDWIES